MTIDNKLTCVSDFFDNISETSMKLKFNSSSTHKGVYHNWVIAQCINLVLMLEAHENYKIHKSFQKKFYSLEQKPNRNIRHPQDNLIFPQFCGLG